MKIAIVILTDSERPIDNGRMVHALHLARDARAAGGQVRWHFCGRGVSWLPKLAPAARSAEDAHPFLKRYGGLFEGFEFGEGGAHVCNFCCKRFNVHEQVTELGYTIVGEGPDHMPLVHLFQDGWQVATF